MAINVQHGPISSALTLARKVGEGIKRDRTEQRDMEFLGMMQQAQADQDRLYASQIQAALRAQDASADNQLRRDALDQQAAATAASLQMRQQDSIADRQLAEQRMHADLASRATTALQKEQQQEATRQYIANLPAGPQRDQALAFFNATGNIPTTARPQNPSVDRGGSDLRSEYSRLRSDLARVKAELAEATYDENDFDRLLAGAQPSARVPGAVAGMEARYQDRLRTMEATQQRMAEIDAALGGRTDSILGVEGGAVDQATIRELMATRAAQPTEGQGQAPVINTAQEYAELPPGALYVDAADGKTYRKKG